MDKNTVTALLNVKREMGAGFLKNTQRVAAFLSDFLPAQPGERRYAERQMLVSLLEAGVPQQLAARHPWSDAELAALAQRSAASLLLDEQATHQGVRVWHFVTHAAPGAAIDIHAILGAATQASQQPKPAAQQPQQPQPPRPASSPLAPVSMTAFEYWRRARQQQPKPAAQQPQPPRPASSPLGSVNMTAFEYWRRTRQANNELLNAVRLGRLVKVRNMLATTVTGVNAKDSDGRTALIWAAASGHPEIVKFLLSAGADVNAKDKNGETALMSAVKMGHAGIVKLLLDVGANVNAKNKEGAALLMHAILNGNTEIIQMLRDAGAQ